MTTQKDVFLTSEGDAWFRRNAAALDGRDWGRDPICKKIGALASAEPLRVLEIGCGEGSRLHYLKTQLGCEVSGIDPSLRAVSTAVGRGIRACQGTADSLPHARESFDVVVFGFCLYLCDDRDLFQIVAEADRVLAKQAWLLIFDFEARSPLYRPYRHYSGVESRKMDYKSMFLWHPAYTLASHEKLHHGTLAWTDDPDEWVSLACLRKCSRS